METLKKNVLRLGVLFLLLEIAIFLLFYTTDRKIQQNIDVAEKESLGLVYITQLQKIRHSLYAIHDNLQLSRFESGRKYSSLKQNKQQLIDDTREQLQELSSLHAGSVAQSLSFKGKFGGLIGDIEALLAWNDEARQLEEIETLNSRVMELILYVSDDLLLFFDPHRESYFLIILVTQKLPDMIENLVRARTLGVKLARQQSNNLTDLSRLQHQLHSFQDGLKYVELFVGLLMKRESSLLNSYEINKKFKSFHSANNQAVTLIDDLVRNFPLERESEFYYQTLSGVIETNQAFFFDISFYLSQLLNERKQSFEREMLVSNVLFAVIILSVFGGAIYLAVDLRAKLRKRIETLNTQNFKALLSNQRSLQKVFDDALGFIAEKMNALKGVCYHLNVQNNKLYLSASYAETEANLQKSILIGEGIVGQVAKDRKVNYLAIKKDGRGIDFGVANLESNVLLTIPMTYEQQVEAVVQLLLPGKLSKERMALLEILLAIAAHHIHNRMVEEENTSIANLVDDYIITSKINEKGFITSVSQAFIDISGFSREELVGVPYNVLRHADMPQALYDDLWQTIESGNSWRGEIKNRTKSGGYYWEDVIMSPDKDYYGNIIGYTAIRQNITDKKKIEELSVRDGMTGLYNRRYFDDQFGKIISEAKSKRSTLYFGIIDVDYFKQYNDNYGHQNGDDVLIAIANALKAGFSGGNECCFRLGGEEFGVLFCAESPSQACHLADAVRVDVENLEIEHLKSNVSQFVTLSIGLLAIKPEGSLDAKGYFHNADQLLYRAKKQGRNRVVFE